MNFEELVSTIQEHRLITGVSDSDKPIVLLKCACGAPFLRVEAHARHVAEIIILLEEK